MLGAEGVSVTRVFQQVLYVDPLRSALHAVCEVGCL